MRIKASHNRLIHYYFKTKGRICSTIKKSLHSKKEEEFKSENILSDKNLLNKKRKVNTKGNNLDKDQKIIKPYFDGTKTIIRIEATTFNDSNGVENPIKKIRKINNEKLKIMIKTVEQEELNFDNLPNISESSQVKILSWNVNGIRSIIKKGNIQDFIEREKPDILCLNETKIDSAALEKIKLNRFFYDKGYASYWNCSNPKKGYSGVAILTRFKPINVTYGLNIQEHDYEGRTLTVEYSNFYLVAVYVPYAGEGCSRLSYRVDSWDIALREYINRLKQSKDVILCGDLNVAHNRIDLKHPTLNEGIPGFTNEERNSFSTHLNSGYIDTFRHLYPNTVKYSYFSHISPFSVRSHALRLDYFIINKESIHRLIDSDILTDYKGSDHTPIKLCWKI